MKKIITVMGYKRPYYLKEVLDSILSADKSEEYDIYITIDNHPTTLEEHKKVINDFRNNFKTDNVIAEYHYNTLGNTGNTRKCFDYSFIDNDYDLNVHLEDDTVIGKDYLLWAEWANTNYGDDPNCFCYCAFMPESTRQSQNHLSDDITLSIKRHWFEAQGGFIMNKSQYQYIIDLGGFFGAGPEPKSWDNYDDYKAKIPKNDRYAFDGPMNWFFKREKYSVTPLVSRSQNIGEIEGQFNPSKEWHNKNVLNSKWIGSEQFRDSLNDAIDYKLDGTYED